MPYFHIEKKNVKMTESWIVHCDLTGKMLWKTLPSRVVKLLRMTSGRWLVISRQSRLMSFVILTLLSLKCAVGPSGRCVTTNPLGILLSSFITIISVYPLAIACLTVFLIDAFLRQSGVELGIIRVNSFTNRMVLCLK